MGDQPEQPFKVIADGQEEEFKTNWRNWISRKITSEKSDTKKPRWIKMLMSHNEDERRRKENDTMGDQTEEEEEEEEFQKHEEVGASASPYLPSVFNVTEPVIADVHQPSNTEPEEQATHPGDRTIAEDDDYFNMYYPYPPKPPNRRQNVFDNDGFAPDDSDVKSINNSIPGSLIEGDPLSGDLDGSRRSSWSEQNFEENAIPEAHKWTQVLDLRMLEHYDEDTTKSNEQSVKSVPQNWTKHLALKDVVAALAEDKEFHFNDDADYPAFGNKNDSFNKDFFKVRTTYLCKIAQLNLSNPIFGHATE